MHNMERSCRAQLAIQASGAEIVRPSHAIAAQTAGQYDSFYDSHRRRRRQPDSEWEAFKRMLERTDPDYKN